MLRLKMHKSNSDMTARSSSFGGKVIVDHEKPVEQCNYIMRIHLD
jgi:hypothetical protein